MKISKFTVLCLAGFLISCGSKAESEKKNAVPAVSTSQNNNVNKAPNFALKNIQGKMVQLSDYRGKVVLLDFWATWCPPCRVSTPELVKLSRKFKDKNFAVVGISLDEDFSVVPAFLKKEGVEHVVLHAGASSVAEQYRVESIPTFYLIDADGVIRKNYSGFYPGLAREWEKDISNLLNSSKP